MEGHYSSFCPVSSAKIKAIIATRERDDQNNKGNPELKFAKLLPKGGDTKAPSCEKVKTKPKAVPEYLGPTPFVSWTRVKVTAIKASIKMPVANTRIHTAMPFITGIRPTPNIAVISAANSIDFLEPILSDRRESGITHSVLMA